MPRNKITFNKNNNTTTELYSRRTIHFPLKTKNKVFVSWRGWGGGWGWGLQNHLEEDGDSPLVTQEPPRNRGEGDNDTSYTGERFSPAR